jgi:hypothetical protein
MTADVSALPTVRMFLSGRWKSRIDDEAAIRVSDRLTMAG